MIMNTIMNSIRNNNHPFFIWLLKTKMSFYNDYELQLPFWFYGICCWNYCLAGMVLLLTKSITVPYLPQWYPYDTFAYFLIFIQSPLSYQADYIHMTHESYWHVLDRITAVPCMILEVIKYYYMVCHALRQFEKQSRKKVEDPQQRTSVCILSTIVSTIIYGGFLLYAMYCYIQSQVAQDQLNRNDFCYWHTMWHCFPIFGSCTILIHSYLYEYDSWYYSQSVQTQQTTMTPDNQSQNTKTTTSTRNKNRHYIVNRAYAVKLINLETTIANE